MAVTAPLRSAAQTPGEVVLHSFSAPPAGANPVSGVIRDAAGNLYGTAGGGTWDAGVVYKVTPSGQEEVLYAFTGGTDGGDPQAGVLQDPEGNLYGTTYSGGAHGAGAVYKLSPKGRESVLYSFTGGSDGGSPEAGVVRDAAGNLYGRLIPEGRAMAWCTSWMRPEMRRFSTLLPLEATGSVLTVV
jgi:uncharacterized repeat protein (TIGR03803 family)